MPEWISILIGLGLIAVVVSLALLKRKPEPIPPQPEPVIPAIKLLGISVEPAHVPTWLDISRWGPHHYALGTPLTFRAEMHDPIPEDALRVERVTWYLVRVGFSGLVASGVSGQEFRWSGEGVGASCGDNEPIEMTVHCVVTLTNGDVLQSSRTFYLVPESACRK